MANTVLRSLVILTGAALFAGGSAFAQANGDSKPPPEPQSSDKSEIAHFADVARAVSGAAANPECIHLGELVVTLMGKNDLDTAQRHINLYDRFGCPGLHLRLSYRCLLNVGMPSQKDEKPNLESRVRDCWINPNLVASAQSAPSPPAAAASTPAATPPAPAAPGPHPPAPAAPAAPATAGTGGH